MTDGLDEWDMAASILTAQNRPKLRKIFIHASLLLDKTEETCLSFNTFNM